MRTCALFQRGQRGFTLVELLVVMAIVAVLAIILVPVYNSVQTSGKRTRSLANLHAVGVGLGQYINDHQNQFPAACNANFTGGFWCDALAPYLPAKVTLTKFDTGQSFTISAALVDPLLPKNRHHPQGDYGCNSDLFYGPAGWPITTTPVSSTILQGRMSTLVAVVTAEATTQSPPCGAWSVNRKDIVSNPPEAWGAAGHPSDRGLGFYLCLFADLHLENVPKDYFVNHRTDLMSLNP